MLHDLVFSEVTAAALRLAATERPAGCPLTTGSVLAALMRVDVAGDWQRIWLYTGDPQLVGLADAPDPVTSGATAAASGPASMEFARWEGVPLTAAMASALRLLERICTVYRLTPAPSGAMAVALLADPASGAASTLLRAGTLTHAELLELTQADLLDTSLEGLAELIARTASQRRDSGQMPSPRLAGNADPARIIRTARRASETAVQARSRHGRRRVLAWRAVSGVALLFALTAVYWHRQVVPPPTQLVLPPYPVPAVAAHLLRTTDLPAAGSGGWLLMQDGPPQDPLFTGTGRFRADLRHQTVVGGWERVWETADSRDVIQVKAFEMRTRGFASALLSGQCQPQTRSRLTGAAVAGYIKKERDLGAACAAALRGRTLIGVTVAARDQPADRAAWRLLSDSMRLQSARLQATARDLPPAAWTNATRTAINSTLMGIMLGVPILLGLVTVTRDRSSWRRLRSRFARRRNADGFSVNPMVDVRLAVHGALVPVRIAILAWTMRLTEDWHLGLWQTALVVAAVIAGMLAAEWLVRRRRPAPRRPAIFSGHRWLIAAASLVLTAAIAGGGAFLTVDGAMISSIDLNPDGSDYLVGQFGRALLVYGVVLILAALLPFTLARRLGMRALREQAKTARPGESDPVLMLRSFADDRRLLRARRLDRASIVERLCLRRYERFEEVAAAALAVHGPVLALSQVGEKLPPPLGAERRSFEMDDWKDRVSELIARARLICVTVGRSESLLWEIGEIRAAGAVTRTIFLLPPTTQGEQRRRLAVLAHALGVDFARLDLTGPTRDVLAVAVPSGDAPVVFTGSAPDDIGYENAITVWAVAVTGDTGRIPGDIRRAAAEFSGYAAAGAQKPAPETASRPVPTPRVYPPGKAPVYRPWTHRMVRWKTLPWTAPVIIGVGFKLAFGNAPAPESLQAPSGVQLLVPDQASSALYAVFDGASVEQVDFKAPSRHHAIQVHDDISGLVVRGSVGYYTSVYSGHVGRIDLLTGKTAWVRSVAVGVQAPALVAGRVVVASPATGTVTALAIGDGHVVARRSLQGTPYGVAASDGHLYVSLARTNQIAELAPDTLRRLATFRVPHGPLDVITQGDRVWVSSTLAHVLAAAGTSAAASPVRQLLTSVQDPAISGNAGWLAIQGMEWVTLLSPTGQLTRTPLPDPHIISLLVQSDGSVIVGYQSGEMDLLRPVKS